MTKHHNKHHQEDRLRGTVRQCSACQASSKGSVAQKQSAMRVVRESSDPS